jgi:8-oxo-dGTP diphosphatase
VGPDLARSSGPLPAAQARPDDPVWPDRNLSASTMLPHQISTLLYAFNERGEVLLLHRRREPNRGLWSPCGGKLETGQGESPYACACREAGEELGLRLGPKELHLTGLVSEHGYAGTAHWLMFLFEIRPRLRQVPAPIDEGEFRFFPRAAVDELPVPQTDRERIWPLFWSHRGGFFAAHCRCEDDGQYRWTLEASQPLTGGLNPGGSHE